MGSSGSKTAKAAGSAARKYPNRPTAAQPPPPAQTNAPRHRPAPATSRQQPGPTVKPSPSASSTRNEAINLDASDPDFARSLRQLGAVQPNPTLSPSSTFAHPNNPNNNNNAFASGNPYPVTPDPRKNPAIMVLTARSRIQEEADEEFLTAGTKGFAGRQFLDVGVIRQVLLMRERGLSGNQIEKQLELRPGVVSKLGAEGVVAST